MTHGVGRLIRTTTSRVTWVTWVRGKYESTPTLIYWLRDGGSEGTSLLSTVFCRPTGMYRYTTGMMSIARTCILVCVERQRTEHTESVQYHSCVQYAQRVPGTGVLHCSTTTTIVNRRRASTGTNNTLPYCSSRKWSSALGRIQKNEAISLSMRSDDT